jgi:hypothetical protein
MENVERQVQGDSVQKQEFLKVKHYLKIMDDISVIMLQYDRSNSESFQSFYCLLVV